MFFNCFSLEFYHKMFTKFFYCISGKVMLSFRTIFQGRLTSCYKQILFMVVSMEKYSFQRIYSKDIFDYHNVV